MIETAVGVAEELSWYGLSAQGLNLAYGVDEPEDSLEFLKGSNSGYQLEYNCFPLDDWRCE